MKKPLLGMLAGLALGAALTWAVLRGHEAKDAHAESPKKEEDAKHDGALHWTKEQQAAAGVATAEVKAVEVKPESKAFGRVLDASSLAATLGDIDSAQAALEASAKEFERVKLLRANGENASARALETAEAALKRDRSLLASARARLVAGWGPVLAERTDLATLAEALLQQKAALVRVDLLPGETIAESPGTVRLVPLVGEPASTLAEVVGLATSADPQNPGAAFLALARATGFVPGSQLGAFVPAAGKPEKGVLLPREAILRHEGEAFVWLQTGDDKFERRRVELGRVMDNGIMAVSGVAEGDRVVVAAAQQMLSDELKTGGGAE